MFIIDTHCHLDILFHKKKIKNIYHFLSLCDKKNFLYLLCVSTSIKNFFHIFSLFSYIDKIKLSCGIHPYYINDINNDDFLDLEKFISYKRIIAVGETGLDYKENIDKNYKYNQINFFLYHLYLANKYKKPCLIHSRNSFNDTINCIEKFDINNFGAVIHCFNYTKKNILLKFLDLGLYISISGLITFKNTYLLQDIIKYLPLDRLLIETDSPYLTPVPYRGTDNDPFKIIYIIKKISILKKVSFYKIMKYNMNNFFNLFKIS